MNWMYEAALNGINHERSLNGLGAIDFLTLENAAHIHLTCDSIRVRRDGWELYVGLDAPVMITTPPQGFDPVEQFPRCPLTGTLFDAHGPVSSCNHEWKQAGDDIVQCVKCREGRIAK